MSVTGTRSSFNRNLLYFVNLLYWCRERKEHKYNPSILLLKFLTFLWVLNFNMKFAAWHLFNKKSVSELRNTEKHLWCSDLLLNPGVHCKDPNLHSWLHVLWCLTFSTTDQIFASITSFIFILFYFFLVFTENMKGNMMAGLHFCLSFYSISH